MTHRLVTATCAAILLAMPALAATRHYHADLLGPTEVPATTSPGTGAADVTLDTATGKLDYSVTWTGLTGPATMAHIHGPAPVGKAAGVVVVLGGMDPASPLAGTATLKPPQIALLTAWQFYVNVHTAANKPGEIRGQLKLVP